jgi:Arc/MetJ family transcription regulator
MPINLSIDDKLLRQAFEVGGFKSKRETVHEALKEFVRRRKKKNVLKLFGKIDWDKKYHYKKSRAR